MTVIVSDLGFAPDNWKAGFIALSEIAANDCGTIAVDLPSNADASALKEVIERIDMIRVDFPSFADGRGFTLATILRRMGFTGRLRARGYVIADQYAMARRSGFDEVEISDELAQRQPEDQWLTRADWQDHNYQARVRG